MNTNGYIEIMRDGWRRTFTLEDKPFPIGYANGQLILPENGELYSPQLIIHPVDAAASQYAIVNMSGSGLHYMPYSDAPASAQLLPYGQPHALSELDRVGFGNYELIYYGERQSELFDAKVEFLKGNRLNRQEPLQGNIFVSYKGADKYAQRLDPTQFDVELLGLAPHCFQRGPSPETPFNAAGELKIPFRLLHPESSYPPANSRRILFAVDCAGQRQAWATISTIIEIEPFYKQKVEPVFL